MKCRKNYLQASKKQVGKCGNKVDWTHDKTIHARIAQNIDDLFYYYKANRGLRRSFDTIDSGYRKHQSSCLAQVLAVNTSIRRTVDLGGTIVSYRLHRKDVKNLNLRIRPDRSIAVSANPGVSEAAIDTFMVSKKKFILKALAKFNTLAARKATSKDYVNGETFTILGRNLRLKLEEALQEGVYSDGVYLHVAVKNKADKRQKKLLIERFLNEQRVAVFGEIMEATYHIFKKYDVKRPRLAIREMQTRWGSCSHKTTTIALNKKLLEVPRPCIEYVVLHEFCHFIHPNHSQQFYDFVAMFMPDWKERKKLLEKWAFM